MKKACAVLVLGLALAWEPSRADTASDAYKAMGIRTADVLTGTVLTARVLPGAAGEAKQVVSVVTYFTGKREEAEAVSVRLDVLRREGSRLVSVYTRDFGKEKDGHVAGGDLELVDLDGDGANEIIVTYDDYGDPLIQQRSSEVIVHGTTGFGTAWSGVVEYDATKAVRTIPAERRDRYTRAVDIPATMRTRGITLMVQKTMIAVAGEQLEQPKVVQETFPLRPAPPGR